MGKNLSVTEGVGIVQSSHSGLVLMVNITTQLDQLFNALEREITISGMHQSGVSFFSDSVSRELLRSNQLNELVLFLRFANFVEPSNNFLLSELNKTKG